MYCCGEDVSSLLNVGSEIEIVAKVWHLFLEQLPRECTIIGLYGIHVISFSLAIVINHIPVSSAKNRTFVSPPTITPTNQNQSVIGVIQPLVVIWVILALEGCVAFDIGR